MTVETSVARGVGSSRLAGVDVLRGVCVLLVVLHHINLRFLLNHFPVQNALPARVEQVLFRSGYYAVVAFFVISGFLITSLSLRRWGSLGAVGIGSFYRMRFARIAPCLLLLTALELGVALMIVAFGSGLGSAAMARGTGWLRAVGRCSYEIYLFHMLVVLGLIASVRQAHAAPRNFPDWYAAMLVGSVLLGSLIAQYFSEPLNQRIRMAWGLVFSDSRTQGSEVTTPS